MPGTPIEVADGTIRTDEIPDEELQAEADARSQTPGDRAARRASRAAERGGGKVPVIVSGIHALRKGVIKRPDRSTGQVAGSVVVTVTATLGG